MGYNDRIDVAALLNKTLTDVQGDVGDDEVNFTCNDGTSYTLYHEQDCCECVRIVDVIGDLKDLIGSPILKAEEVSNFEEPEHEYSNDSHTWTFYHFATINGYVTIRWLGESNGYYSESVSFVKVNN